MGSDSISTVYCHTHPPVPTHGSVLLFRQSLHASNRPKLPVDTRLLPIQPHTTCSSHVCRARLCVALRAAGRARHTRRLRGSITTPKVTQTYDQNGHLAAKTVTPRDLSPTGISKGLQSHINLYNAAERLVKVSDGSNNEIASYAYNPFGQRIKKTVSQNPGGSAGVTLGTTFYFYADEGLIAETDGTGNLTVSYGWNPDGMWGTAPVWKRDILTASATANAIEHYYHVDHLGTPQRLTNHAGEVTWRAFSEAFGKTAIDASVQPVTTAVTVNSLRFPGQVEDGETGTRQNFFRDYDPNVGRYVQSDPIGLDGGVNTYAYVLNRPLFDIDPTGENAAAAAAAAAYAAIRACGANKKCRCEATHLGYSILCRMKQCGSSTSCAEAVVASAATAGCVGLRTAFLTLGCSKDAATKQAQIEEVKKRAKNLVKCPAEVTRLCGCGALP